MISDLLQTLVRIAGHAGDLVIHSYRTTFDLKFKGPQDPVTSADCAANELICSELAKAFPGWPIVAEESDPQHFMGYQGAESVFFVDPIDGTQEFVDHTDEFVVMIGLVQRGQAVAGVIHSPVTGQFWLGEVGRGAFKLAAPGADAEAIHVRSQKDLSLSRILVSRGRRQETLEGPVARLGAAALDSVGSAGLKAALVAEGHADAYVAPHRAGKRWDACAPDAVVSAAGGAVSDALGQPIDYNGASLANDRGMVVSNKELHGLILQRMAGGG